MPDASAERIMDAIASLSKHVDQRSEELRLLLMEEQAFNRRKLRSIEDRLTVLEKKS